MAVKTCFVVMPIGDQSWDGGSITAVDLRKRYDDLIREALTAANSSLEIVRADDVARPGTMTMDIVTRIMHSDIVVADVTYPNPNVFYELGLRHGCRNGTIIIRDKSGPSVPFDISHLRHIPYENTPTGLKDLTSAFRKMIDQTIASENHPDNQLQELAKLTKFKFPDYGTDETDPELEAATAIMSSPDFLQLMVRKASGEDVKEADFLKVMVANPDLASMMAKAMVKSGQLGLPSKPPSTTIRNPYTKNRKRK